MNESEPRVSKEMAPEIFERASRLYAQKHEDYSLSELVEAGAEARIPPEFIREAVRQIQIEQSQVCQQQEKQKLAAREFRRTGAITVGLAIVSAAFFTFAGEMGFSCNPMMSANNSGISQSK